MNGPKSLAPTRSRSRSDKRAVAVLVVVIRKDLHMCRGTEIAQACHAMEAYLTGTITRKICVQVTSESELDRLHKEAICRGVASHLIVDSGKTEFHGVPTKTVLLLGSDALTKELAFY